MRTNLLHNNKIFLIFVALHASNLIGKSNAFLLHPPSHRMATHIRIPPKALSLLSFPMTTNNNNNNNSDEQKPTPPPWSKALTLAIWSIPLDALAIHYGGWNHLGTSLYEMKSHSSPDEFASALQFWLLGALSHPFMDAAFGISELMHSCPGPRVAGLVPISFLVGSGVCGAMLVRYDRLRQFTLSTTFALFLAYLGAGLEGTMPTDYNLQLDDEYQQHIVKGCPAAETVQTASVQSFQYPKDYGGRWYWHAVHDWTQFHQMYDHTLDIQLTDKGYTNTLTMKGPSPHSAPLSWDKSPLLHGIRYSWQGTIMEKDNDTEDATAVQTSHIHKSKKGISMESGFGVSFPNYIVDVSSDGQELVQFQCIEVGGVRLYEGIDFMSRSPQMTDVQLQAMHDRVATQLNPYGASPEQMHRIERRSTSNNNNDDDNEATTTKTTTMNEWQKLWQFLQIDQYLDQSLQEIE